MNPIDVKSSTYTDSGTKNSDKNPKFKFGDHVRISKSKSTFAKGYALNWSEVLSLKMLKMLFRGHMLLVILQEIEEIVETS